MMQKLWDLEVDWDQNLPQDLEDTWTKFLTSITHLPKLQVPRNVNPGNAEGEMILHGFCDASKKAYGACVYVVSSEHAVPPSLL